MGDGNANTIVNNNAATSVRQLSEWGMRMIQASHRRLRDLLPIFCPTERRVILHLMVHLFNFQASQVGMNQILNSFIDHDCYYNYGTISDDANYLLM